LETIYVQSALLDATSLTYSYDPLVDGQQLCVQWSAHGRSLLATLSLKGECRLDFSEEIRPIAPGQSVVFYREDEPSVVLGAAVVTR
jgi:tRNA U34 2-thiouridine synthase MnmA/TrmU